VDVTRHPKFPLTFGELASGGFPHCNQVKYQIPNQIFQCVLVFLFDPNGQSYQGSPHLQKTGRLDFSLREHEGEVKA
jgi:hypothetical protein